MIYLPVQTTDAIYMEEPSTKKWWICALAMDGGSRDLCFTCWGDHPKCPNVLAQGKTLARGNDAKRMWRLKIEEKEQKGYVQRSSYDDRFTHWKPVINNQVKKPYSAPKATTVIPGMQEGSLTMTSLKNDGTESANRLTMDLYRGPQGYRLDQREWFGPTIARPTFPDWQTLYPNAASALVAIAGIRDNRISEKGLRVATESIPWHFGHDKDNIQLNQDWLIPSAAIIWDF